MRVIAYGEIHYDAGSDPGHVSGAAVAAEGQITMAPTAASSTVTPIRGRVDKGGRVAVDAELRLRALALDHATQPADFDTFAEEQPTLRPLASMLSALARIAAERDDEAAGHRLRSVLDFEPDEAAIAIVERMPPSTHTVAARVALLSAAERHSDVLALTHGIDDVDDVTALLLVYRAAALAAMGLSSAAHETWSAVLRARRYDPQIRRLARDLRDAAWADEVAPQR